MKEESRIVIGVAAILLACDTAAHAQPAVWITDSLAKVQPNATPGTSSSLNLFAARNEFESFQVHVQASSAPISLSVSVTDFVNNADGSRISANPNIAVFREAYVTVTTPSDLNGITGQVPDQLIPVEDAYFHQPRNAFPVTVPTGQTRSAWVDVFVPPAAEAGYYTASAKVMDGANVIATLPVNLKVWNFTLPSTSTLKSAFGMGFGSLGLQAYTYGGLGAYPGSGGNPVVALDLIHAAVATFFLDHRVSLAPVVDPTYPSGNWSEFDSTYGPLISGAEPTILPGARLSVLQYANTLRPANNTDLLDWVGHFSGLTAPQQLFGYMCDEPPGGCNWSDVYNYGTAAHAVAPSFPILVTTSIALATQNNVLSAIDILAPVLDYVQPMNAPSTRPAYNTWLQLPGKQIWWYQSCDQHETCVNGTPGPVTSTWPVYTIDASPVRNRIFQWLAYLYGIQGELYYYVENWGPNAWTDVYSTGGNGDGVLYYPGTVDVIGGTVPVPVASMRLKLIRDGMEDFEYLNALSQAGQSSFAATVSSTFIQNAYSFNNDPSALTSARFAMGELLNGLAIPPPILASPAKERTGVSLTPTLRWNASAGATSYDVYFGTSSTPPFVTNVTATSHTPATLAAGTTYYWQIVAKNTAGTAASLVWSFTTTSTTVAPRGVSPAAGGGATQAFTFTFADVAGYADLSVLDVLISTFLNGQTACYFALAPTSATTGYIYLVDDAGDGGYAGAPMPLPSAGLVQNSQCSISGTGSSVSASGNTLTLTLTITFKSAFAGNKAVYMAARSNTQNSGWQVLGTWNVPGTPAGPAVGGVSPARSTSLGQTYTFTFTDSNGYSDLFVLDILTNGVLDGFHACYVAYVPTTPTNGYLYLVDDAGDGGYAPGSPIALSSGGVLQNSQCAINTAGSSTSESGNTLTLNLAMTFKVGFAGNQVFYLAARNNSTGNSGWQAAGSVTVP